MVHHCCTVLRYTNEADQERGLKMDFCATVADPVEEHESWNALTDLYDRRTDTSESINNVGHILKMQLLGKTKMVLEGGGARQLFGIDLLNNNIYLSSEGARGLEGLPLTQSAEGRARFSISIDDLKNPDEIGTYYIRGEETSMTHREALEAFTRLGGERFHLPPDFAENVLTLAKSKEELFSDILLPPADTARKVWKPATQAGKINEAVNEKYREFHALSLNDETPVGIQELCMQYKKQAMEVNALFRELQQAIMDGNPSKVMENGEKIKIINETLTDLAQQISGDPLELMLK